MRKRNALRYLPFSTLVLLGTVTTHADTTTLSSSADTFISSLNPNFNDGANSWFDAGTDNILGVRRGLVRFDLSSIPAGSTVTSAVLHLTVNKVPPAPSTSQFDLYRVAAAWNEGNKVGLNGAQATTGEATWNARMFGVANWTVPGALSDVSGGVSASTAVSPVVGDSFSWASAGLVSDVQYWLDNAANNFGWLLVCEAESTRESVIGFTAREGGAGGPTLQVGYTPAATTNLPPVVSITSPTNGESFAAPATVVIQANATDPDGSVTNVQFFDGSTALGNVSTSPFTLSVNLFPGTHTLMAVASDNLGASTTSSNVTITIGSVVITNPIGSLIPKGNISVELQTVADGMASALGMAVPDDGSGRMFVYDQDGHIWIVSGGNRSATPLLDVSSRLVQLAAYDERGLLGLAVHPGFAQHPLIYTQTSEPTNGPADFQTGVTNDHQSVIAEWRISASNSNVVDVTTRREVLRIDEPQANNNGGAMHFGPDGLLYFSLGDGGQANDVGPGDVSGGNAQDITRIWGKMIRIDVEGRNSTNGQYGIPPSNPFVGTNGLPEIYAFGLRNPFAFSFDRNTDELWAGDVGQNNVEEVDKITGGGNYGWNLREGGFWFDPSTGNDVTAPVRPPPPNLIDPVAQYGHDDGLAVIGGYVYRGAAIPALAGRYVFGDWGSFSAPSGRLFCLDATNGINELRIGGEDRRLGLWLKGFGEGPDGELYVFGSRWLGPSGSTGRMLKIVPPLGPISLTGLVPVNGTNVTATWSGGTVPCAVQQKVSLDHPLWQNAAVAAEPNVTLPQNSAIAFFRVAEAAHVPRIPLSAWFTSAAEHPTNSSTATAFGIFALDENTLTLNISYTGLSGPAFAAHIHGPTNTSGDASVLIDLGPYNGGAWGTSGTVSGVILLTDEQKAMVLGGLTYANFHTAANPGGEIRGQIVPVNLQLALNGASEIPPVSTPATGLGNLMLVGNQLTINLTYQGLSGVATASHIHGPATTAQNAGVLISLAPYNGGVYGTFGSLSGTVTLTTEQLANVVDGLTYVNFHTPAHPAGEMRGQIIPQVTAVPLTLSMSGLAERPNALTNTAFGNGGLCLEGNTLTFNILYGGLSGPAIAAHIHGPANSTGSAGVMVDLSPFNGGAFGSAGTVSGSVVLTTGQRDAMLNGLTYIHFHTAANPGGELRGQVAPVIMTTGLNGVNERPTRIPTPGTGSGTFALVRDQLALCVSYSGLLTTATASHIHGPSSLLDTAAILVDLSSYNGVGYGSSGALSGTAPLSVGVLLDVIDGQTYINFHTTNNPSGEIRGQLIR